MKVRCHSGVGGCAWVTSPPGLARNSGLQQEETSVLGLRAALVENRRAVACGAVKGARTTSQPLRHHGWEEQGWVVVLRLIDASESFASHLSCVQMQATA